MIAFEKVEYIPKNNTKMIQQVNPKEHNTYQNDNPFESVSDNKYYYNPNTGKIVENYFL